MKNKWNCIPRAFAIALGIPYIDIITAIGHDGSEKIWEGLSDPWCRRAFHIQELINVAWNFGFTVTPFEFEMASAPMDSVGPLISNNGMIALRVMQSCNGVALGTLRNDQRHASAWIDGKFVEDLYDFKIETFYAIKSTFKEK